MTIANVGMYPTGIERGPVVAEREAEAAVAAAKTAACHHQEQALQQCNNNWTARLGEWGTALMI